MGKIRLGILAAFALLSAGSHAAAEQADVTGQPQNPTVLDAATAADALAEPQKAVASYGAPAGTCEPDNETRAPKGGVFTALVENDAFDLAARLGTGATTDRYFTHGTLFSFVSKCEPLPEIEGLERIVAFLADEEREARWGLSIGQNIYTPEDLTATDPSPNDRPYAGWAYIAPSVVVYTPNSVSVLELQVGLVGPSAAADWVQGNWHDAIRIARAQGWTHQLKDEVGFVLFGERRWVSNPIPIIRLPGAESNVIEADLTGRAALALGTVQMSAAGGVDVRIGQGLGTDYGPPRIRPSLAGASFFNRPAKQFTWYLFAGVEVRAVARDIFLDGNTWVDSPSIGKRNLVVEAQGGAAVVLFRRVRIVYSHVVRSEEFRDQDNPSHFGSISVSVVFGRDPH